MQQKYQHNDMQLDDNGTHNVVPQNPDPDSNNECLTSCQLVWVFGSADIWKCVVKSPGHLGLQTLGL